MRTSYHGNGTKLPFTGLPRDPRALTFLFTSPAIISLLSIPLENLQGTFAKERGTYLDLRRERLKRCLSRISPRGTFSFQCRIFSSTGWEDKLNDPFLWKCSGRKTLRVEIVLFFKSNSRLIQSINYSRCATIILLPFAHLKAQKSNMKLLYIQMARSTEYLQGTLALK